jgi:hypothetical protein
MAARMTNAPDALASKTGTSRIPTPNIPRMAAA